MLDFLFYFIPVINSGYWVGIAGDVQQSKLWGIEKMECPPQRAFHFSKCPPMTSGRNK
jgi:hypothetical protein